jgi:hypothetical protein
MKYGPRFNSPMASHSARMRGWSEAGGIKQRAESSTRIRRVKVTLPPTNLKETR